MPTLIPSLYELKKAIMWPRTLYMRRKFSKTQEPLRTMLELHYYRRAMLDFIGATSFNRHILHEADINADSVVVDVGAFTGDWAKQVLDRYDPTIYAFEPNPQSFERLQQKAQNNPKLKPVPYGLGDEDLTVDFTIKGLGSSMYEERSDHADVPRMQVELADVDRVWRELDLGRVNLMKVNIEGAEFPLFERMMASGLLDSVDTYLIQFHEWHPGAYRRRRRIRKALAKTHKLEWDYSFVWEKWVRK